MTANRRWIHFQVAWDSLRGNKLRAALTVLGMVFGVAAFIAMLAITQGARDKSLQLLDQMGVNNLYLLSVQPQRQPDDFSPHGPVVLLNLNDVPPLRALPGIDALAPVYTFQPRAIVPFLQSDLPPLYAVPSSYARIHSLHLLAGRFFDSLNDRTSEPVCVLGAPTSLRLFGTVDAIGKKVQVNEVWLRVIGVLDAGGAFTPDQAGAASGASSSSDADNVIFVPFSTLQRRFRPTGDTVLPNLQSIEMAMHPGPHRATVALVGRTLARLHNGVPNYRLVQPEALIAQREHAQRIFAIVMLAIAAISLLVGGIGIMNVVLTSVLERRHEIGIRRATGARQLDIRRQFLTEAVLLASFGGVLGILLGLALAGAVARLAHWPTLVPLWAVLAGLGLSGLVGIAFGLYPAHVAARLDPIEALRYE